MIAISDEIATTGYKNQGELNSNDRECGVSITRQGFVLKVGGGRHRFAMAVYNDVKTIPVEIRHIHIIFFIKALLRHRISAQRAILKELNLVN